ncbi:AAA family ATPase [Amycolatopsis sp. NPDC049868]|uniref:AAA family ATPase n=1 Tax=Amycolatopsis sp. NPDC049868 TaxID=3363934 RepID=UPI0037BBC28C
MTGDAILRRHFVAIATAEYDDEHWSPLPIGEEVAALRAWLCADQLDGRRFEHRFPELADNPAKRDIREALEDPPPDHRWRDADAAVVFVTGHAEEVDKAHHLILKETDSARRGATALASFELIRWLACTDITHLVVIVDTCYAGLVIDELARLDKGRPESWVILAGAAKTQQAYPGRLSRAITAFLDKLASREGAQFGHAPYLSVEDLLDGLKEHLDRGQTPDAVTGLSRRSPHVCLPNPHYRPDAVVEVAPARQDLALSRQDLRTHWGPKARGVATDDEPGWLFTGRAELTRALIAAATGEPGTTLVTGAAGSGKSAVLARLVTLSDPRFRRVHAAELKAVPDDLMPPSGAVDVAVVATGKLETEVLDQILRAFEPTHVDAARTGADLDDRLAAWHASLLANNRMATVVVDAVDEAAAPHDLLTTLLARLEPNPRKPQVRLLLGLRSPGGDGRIDQVPFAKSPLAEVAETRFATTRIRVDEAPWWNAADVVGYVAGILRDTPGSRYHGDIGTRTTELAATIGAQAGRSFLFARLAATSLAHGTLGTSWREALLQGVTGVFKADLHGTFADPADRHRAIVLLRAVAFAYGAGLPWRKIWPRVATAIGDSDYEFGDTDISWLLDSRLGAYLITDRNDDTTVYRLFHDLLRDTLRDDWHELLDHPPLQADPPAAAEARIAAALADLMGPGTPPTYVRRHIVEHAAAGGVLDDRFLKPDFLPYVDAARLRSVTARISTPEDRLLRHWRSTPQRSTLDSVAINADALRFRLAAVGYNAGKIARTGDGWEPRWLRWTCEHAEILTRCSCPVLAVATVTLPGDRPIVLVGGDDGALSRWDPVSGEQIGDPLLGHSGAIKAIATAALDDGRVVAVTGSTDGTSRVWDIAAATPIGTPFVCEGVVSSVAVIRLPDGRVVAIVSDDGAKVVRLRDVVTGEPADPFAADVGHGSALAGTALPDGRVLALAATPGGAVHVWDVTTGDTLHVWDRVTGDQKGAMHDPALLKTIRGTATAVVADVLPGGRTVAVVGGSDGELWFHDLVSGDEILTGAIPEEFTVRAMALVDMPGEQAKSLVVLADRLWIAALGEEQLIFKRIGSGALALHSLATIALPDRSVAAVTGGRDNVVRLWHLTTDAAAARTEAEWVRALTTARLPKGREIAVHNSGESLRLVDLRSGSEVRRIEEGRRVNALKVLTLPDGRVAVAGSSGWDPLIRVWDLATGDQVSEIWTGHAVGVAAMATAVLPDGQTVVISAGSFGSGVHLWDPGSGASLGRVSRGPFAGARSIERSPRSDGMMNYEIGNDEHPWNGYFGIQMALTAVLPDGRVVALASGDDGTVCVWDLVTRRRLGDVNLGCSISTGVTLTWPDGRCVAVLGGADGMLRTVDIATVRLFGTPGSAHSGPVEALTAVRLADGRPVVISAGNDGVVQAWDPVSARSIGHPLLLDGEVLTVHGVSRRKAPQLLIGGNGVACMELRIDER